MDFTGGFFAPSPPPSRGQSPAPRAALAVVGATSNIPATSSPLAQTTAAAATDANELQQQEAGQTRQTAVAGTTSAPQGLEQELSNVMAGLGGWWGRVRKQSVEVYHTAEKQMETARKDLTPLVSKARANLDSISESTRAELARLSEPTPAGSNTGVIIGADGVPIIIDEPAPVEHQYAATATDDSDPTAPRTDKGKGVDRGASDSQDGATDSVADSAAHAGATAAAFFAKLQSQVASNPNVKGLSKNLATLQHQVQNNLSTLPNSLQANLNQLQDQFAHIDLSRATAEDYLHKGEHWISDFSAEVQRLATDAVKVVPASEVEFSSERSRKRDERARKAEQVAVGRRDLLVIKLRSDVEALKVDPAQPPVSGGADMREAFARFLQRVEDEDGGLEGESWRAKVAHEREAGGDKLEETAQALVKPRGELDGETFWARYFFRLAQIDEDEERRRKVLEVAENDDDDFSWDMEEEEEEEEEGNTTVVQHDVGSVSATSAAAAAAESTPDRAATPSSATTLVPPTAAGLAASSLSSVTPTDTAPDTPRAGGDANSDDDDGEGDWGLSTTSVSASASASAPASASVTAATSPRVSSDGGTSGSTAGSYDVVGQTSGVPSEVGDGYAEERERERRRSDDAAASAASAAPAHVAATASPAAAAADESDDSDWE